MKTYIETVHVNEKAVVTDLYWERIFLNFTIEVREFLNVKFALADLELIEGDETKTEYECKQVKIIEPEKVTENKYHFSFNMAAFDGKNFIENGRWYFVTIDKNNKMNFCTCTTELGYKLREMDKIFSYYKNEYSYNVFFRNRTTDEENLVLIMYSMFMMENNKWQRNCRTLEKRTLEKNVRRWYNNIKKKIVCLLYNWFAKRAKKDGKHILFMTETKPYLSGNLKHIDEKIRERELDKEFNLSYSSRVMVGTNNSMKSWIKLVKLMAEQDIIFIDDYAPIFNYLELSDSTKLIQVWHAGEGFKSVGYSRFGIDGSPHPTQNAHKRYDYVITGSERLVKVYSEAFGLPKENIFPLGMARLDGFLDEKVIKEKRNEFYSKYPKLREKKLILFSPTFRGTGQKYAAYDYSQLNLQRIHEFCGNDYVWAYKMHPFIKEKPDIPDRYKDRIIDLSSYENINDLYYVTEIMITDYSSAYYEFALMSKPILFFTYDREIYELTRYVHKPVKESAPGKVCDTFDELMKALETGDFEIKKTLKFREENYKDFDGRAADRIINKILLNQ